jgi:hypothetical protein
LNILRPAVSKLHALADRLRGKLSIEAGKMVQGGAPAGAFGDLELGNIRSSKEFRRRRKRMYLISYSKSKRFPLSARDQAAGARLFFFPPYSPDEQAACPSAMLLGQAAA